MTESLISKEEMIQVAKLAFLPLSPEELEALIPQLESIVEFVSKLQSVPTQNIEPTSQVTNQVNNFRDDTIEKERILSQDQALSSAPVKYQGFFVVPRISWE